jgi:hypothetical protein
VFLQRARFLAKFHLRFFQAISKELEENIESVRAPKLDIVSRPSFFMLGADLVQLGYQSMDIIDSMDII